jgi:hypothetical protein
MWLAVSKDPVIPTARVHGHRGDFNILTTTFNGQSGTGTALRVDIDGDGTNTKVLELDNMFWNTGSTPLTAGDVWRDTSSPAAQAALSSSNTNGGSLGFGTLPNVTNKVVNADASDAAILEGLKVLRAARIEPPNVRPPNVTDVKMFRIRAVTGPGKTGLEIRRSDEPTPDPTPIPTPIPVPTPVPTPTITPTPSPTPTLPGKRKGWSK